MTRSFFKKLNAHLWWLLTYLFLFLSASITWLYTMLFLNLKVEGQDNIPTNRFGLILAANHQAYIDSWFIITFMKCFTYLFLHPRILPWNTPESKNFYCSWLGRLIFKHLRCIPVKRGKMTLREMKFFFSEIKKILLHYNLLIFFEGTRSRTGEIGGPKEGVGSIIYHNQHCLVIPVRIRGFDKVWPVNKNWFISLFWNPLKNQLKGRGKIPASIIYGQALDFIDLFQQPGNKETYQAIGQRIKKAVEAL